MQPYPRFGQVWQVFDKLEHYPALVLNVGKERVKIARVLPRNVKATPTFARLAMFTGEVPGYVYLKELAT